MTYERSSGVRGSAGTMRGGKIDYSNVEVIRRRALSKSQSRGGREFEYVVGGFRLVEGVVVLVAVECGPAWNVTGEVTTDPNRFYRWRTKQAAWQWLQLRPSLDLRVIHLGRLDVLSMRPSVEPRPASGLA